MKQLEEVKKQISIGNFYFSRHAFKRIIERNISDEEIKQISQNIEIIEDYGGDKYTPSCLILGFTKKGRPLHIQVSLSDSEFTKIITIYEPDDTKWKNHKIRRKNDEM